MTKPPSKAERVAGEWCRFNSEGLGSNPRFWSCERPTLITYFKTCVVRKYEEMFLWTVTFVKDAIEPEIPSL